MAKIFDEQIVFKKVLVRLNSIKNHNYFVITKRILAYSNK
jgi:hypothetical protein